MQKKKLPKILIIIIILVIIFILIGVYQYFQTGEIIPITSSVVSQNKEKTTIQIEEDAEASISDNENTETTIQETEEELIYETESENDEPTINITLDSAKIIATSDAECNIASVSFVEEESEDIEGYTNWILAFTYENTKYNYTINAYDGRILERSEEDD